MIAASQLPLASCDRHVEILLTIALHDESLTFGRPFARWANVGGDIVFAGRHPNRCNEAVWACPDKFNTANYTGTAQFYGDSVAIDALSKHRKAKKHVTEMFHLKFTSWILT